MGGRDGKGFNMLAHIIHDFRDKIASWTAIWQDECRSLFRQPDWT